MRFTRIVSMALVLSVLGACGSNPPTDGNPQKSAAVNAQMGLRYMQMGNYQVAQEKLERALAFDANSFEANHYMAELYRRLGESEKADGHFRRARRAQPDNTALINNYGVFLCENERFEEAEVQFLQVLENPFYRGKAQTYENLGLCLRAHDREKAEAYLRQGLQIEPKMPKSLVVMAEISLEKGSHLSARAYLQRYLEIGRHSPRTLWLGVRIERVLGDKNALASYGLSLRNNYPDSEETRLYLESK